MLVLTSKHYSGHQRATEEQGDRPRNTWRRDLEKEMWNSGTTGGRWRRQLMTELDGIEWSVAYDPRRITMTKSGC